MLEPIVVIGLAKSGASALSLLLDLNIPRNKILTYDAKLTTADTSKVEDVLQFKPKTLVVSPGVPLTTPWIVELQKSGAKITSELSLATQFLKTEKIIGITGSLGKSTTTAALGAAALAIDLNCFVGGNLGTPLSQYAHEVYSGQRKRAQYIILELSSFHLENCEGLSLDQSIITFLSANHLERYRNIEHYYETKLIIAEKTKGQVFLNQVGGDLKAYFYKTRTDSEKFVWIDQSTINEKDFNFTKAKILGRHNRDNLALAFAIIQKYAWHKDSVNALLGFSGLDHRLQNVGEFKGILFINDSKATALDSVTTAFNSCVDLNKSDKIHLLIGGRDKNLPWEDLNILGKTQQAEFYFFGECRDIARKNSRLQGQSFTYLQDALNAVFLNAKPKDIVLLSPGGTSLDEFKNFEDRGNCFVNAVLAFAKN